MKHGGDIYSSDIRLDFSVNLNPVPCPESVRRALGGALENADKYPDPKQTRMRRGISRCEKIDEDRILGGNGASELFLGVLRSLKPKKVLLPRPGFTGYIHAVNAVDGCRAQYYDLLEEDGFVLTDSVLDKIDSDTDLVVITNPNNPTGRLVSEQLMSKILCRCRELGCALVIDESFIRMSEGISFARYTYDYDKLYILNAYTKLFSIPGVRVGFLITSPENIEPVRAQLPEWNMSVIAQEGAAACAKALIYTDFKNMTLRTIREEREYLSQELGELGIKVYDSDTSFMLIKSSLDLYTLLKEKHILIRSCSDFGGLDKDMYRIAVKSTKQNDLLIDAIKEIIEENDDRTRASSGYREEEL